MNKCTECGSYAINHHCHGRDGSDQELCDVCYWRVRATDYATLEAECERLRAQVSALQPLANSWQSGYDKGREDGARAADRWKTQHARDSAELRRLCSERDALRQQRDKLAGLLRDVKSAYTTAIHWEDMRAAMAQIDTALSELTP